MQELKAALSPRLKNDLENFISNLKVIYSGELISVVLYGSVASGEFSNRHSNLNLLVVLKETDLRTLGRAAKAVLKLNKSIHPLFLTPDYINRSTDIFPIEFLDMRENYL